MELQLLTKMANTSNSKQWSKNQVI